MAEEFTPPQLETAVNLPGTPAVASSTETVVVAPSTAPAIVAADYIQCGFCKCNLTPKGHVYEVSDTARAYSDANEDHRKAVKKLDEEISRLNSEVSRLNAELREKSNTPKRDKFL